MDYYIRKFEKEDTPFLWEMLYQSIHVPDGEPLPSRDILEHPSIKKYLEEWGRKTDNALIATDNLGEPVGAIWIRLFSVANAGWGFIDEHTPELGMAILAEHRGKGIGRRLLSQMSTLSHSLGYAALSLSVDPRNSPALRLYETSGYVKVLEDEGGSWTMKKTL